MQTRLGTNCKTVSALFIFIVQKISNHIFRNVDEYVVGSRKKLEMSITVKNRGEDSYETMFYMRMPYDVQYIRTNKSAHNVSLET